MFAQARTIHARTARLVAPSSSLSTPPYRAIISARDFMAIAGFPSIFFGALVVCLVENFMVWLLELLLEWGKRKSARAVHAMVPLESVDCIVAVASTCGTC